jgi:polar amino acid transport system ATP-binding protein
VSSDVIVDVKGVTKCFGHRTIFSNVSMQVHMSEVVAVIGPSGAGKSTLVRCINQLTSFEHGTITVLGRRVDGTQDGKGSPSKATLRELRMQCGMVFQTFNLFPHLSVTENIALAPRRVLKVPRSEAQARAERLLAMLGLSHRANAYPARLSGGEQQRVAICRALAMEPKVMLFDEPTSMLDPELVGEVLQAIQRLAQRGMTMVLVTHEMGFARDIADTVVVMADGCVVESGSAREVLTQPRTDRTRQFLNRILAPSSDLRLTRLRSDASSMGSPETSHSPSKGLAP